MKRSILLAFIAVLAMAFVMPAALDAQVKVTFVLNTALVPDTIVTTSSVTVTGNKDSLTNWGAGTPLVNIGGDYWSQTITLTPGDSVAYKFRVIGAWEDNSIGGESFTGSSGNRTLVVGTSDTTLPVQFANYSTTQRPQYWKPWVDSPDTIRVLFRVNMQGTTMTFNPPADRPGVRGDHRTGTSYAPDMSWGTTSYFIREASNTNFTYNGTHFWHGVISLPKSKVASRDSIGYKFIINDDWGRADANDRLTWLPTPPADTTIYWAWFNNEKPISRANHDTVVVTYTVNMTKALNSGGFNSGDTLEVSTGDFGTISPTPSTKRLLQQVGALYSVKDTVVTSRGSTLDYQYYVNKNGVRTRENYYNFYFTGELAPEAERRQVIVPTVGALTVRDTAATFTSARRQPDFPNSRKLARDMHVTFEVDVRPAYYQVMKGDSLSDIQGIFTVTKKDSVIPWGVYINGLSTGTWAGWGGTLFADTTRKMWDDGTHGDRIAHDSIFTRVIVMGPDSTAGSKGIVGQVFKFGLHGGDNEGGRGGFGNNHNENVVDATSAYTVVSQWGSMNPAFYNAWDYDNHRPASTTGVQELAGVALVYSLNQNYPNPFNPATQIEYTVPTQNMVTLKVYNLLGQEVATLVNQVQKAAKYSVKFDASRLASGVYFYRLTAGNYVNTMKMLLLK